MEWKTFHQKLYDDISELWIYIYITQSSFLSHNSYISASRCLDEGSLMPKYKLMFVENDSMSISTNINLTLTTVYAYPSELYTYLSA